MARALCAVTKPARNRPRQVRHAGVSSTPRVAGSSPTLGGGVGACRSLGQDFGEVLVASARQAHEDKVLVELAGAGEGVGGLERRDDSLEPRQVAEGGQRFLVS